MTTTINYELYYANRPVANVAALKAVDTTSVVDGATASIASNGIFTFERSSSATPDDINVVQPNTGPGRWFRQGWAGLKLNGAGTQIDASIVTSASTSVSGVSQLSNLYNGSSQTKATTELALSTGLGLVPVLAQIPTILTLYVDGNRVDTYTPNGTLNFPYKTVQSAVNAANAIASTFGVSIVIAHGNYNETVLVSGTGLYNLYFTGVGEVLINQINATTTLTNLNYLSFDNISFGSDVIIGSTVQDILAGGCSFVDCIFSGQLTFQAKTFTSTAPFFVENFSYGITTPLITNNIYLIDVNAYFRNGTVYKANFIVLNASELNIENVNDESVDTTDFVIEGDSSSTGSIYISNSIVEEILIQNTLTLYLYNSHINGVINTALGNTLYNYGSTYSNTNTILGPIVSGTSFIGSVKAGSFYGNNLTANSLIGADASKQIVTITALPNGTTATTQSALDNSTKVATTAYVDNAVGVENLWDRALLSGSTYYVTPHTSTDITKVLNNIYIGLVDAFSRNQFWNYEANAVIRLGALAQDGDPVNASSEGIVSYGQNAQADTMDTLNWGYSRIKPYRFGIYNSKNGGYVGYLFRLDTQTNECYLKANDGTKTFNFDRSAGVMSLGGSSPSFYFGDASTDGTWRIVLSGNDLSFERRESGTYVSKGKFLATA